MMDHHDTGGIAVMPRTPHASHNPLGVHGIDHIHFYVDDALAWSQYYIARFGMYPRAVGRPETGLDGRLAYAVGQGRVTFVFTQPLGDGASADEVRKHLAKHGCGVRDVAFRVKDAKHALTTAVAAGAAPAADFMESAVDGVVDHRSAAIHTYGDTLHSFIERPRHGRFAPGFENVAGGIEDNEISFAMIDHVVANVEHMDEWVDFYHRVFGFDQTAHFDIKTGKSALMSKVVGDEDGYIKLPINEPSSKNSQIQEFIDEYGGPGVQHIALLTPNIVATVSAMRIQGVSFMTVPDSYYDEEFRKRVGKIKEDIEELKSLGVLVDRDRPDGYLLQIFTHPIFGRPTLFHEVIQRRGNSDGFGEGNFKALFEAIEREQARRGTL